MGASPTTFLRDVLARSRDHQLFGTSKEAAPSGSRPFYQVVVTIAYLGLGWKLVAVDVSPKSIAVPGMYLFIYGLPVRTWYVHRVCSQ